MTGTKEITFTKEEKSAFIRRTYGWMALALFISSAVAWFTATAVISSQPGEAPSTLFQLLFGKSFFGIKAGGYMVLCFLEIAVVFWLTSRIQVMSVFTAVIGFLFYSVINGLTLSSIFAAYSISSIGTAFLSTGVTFLVMCIFGTVTKTDLTKFGRYLMMALLGIIIASVLQFVIGFFTGAPLAMMDLLISIASIIIFTGLAAWDAQKILKTAQMAKNNDDYKKVAILGALELYLDFINLLLALLRFTGKRKE